MKVADICSHRIISASISASLLEAAALMFRERVGTVIATRSVAGRALVAGILTDRDIVHVQLDRVTDLSQLCITDAMSPDPLVVRADDDVSAVLHRLRDRGVRRAPVVDDSGAAIGLVSIDDLLPHIAGEIDELAAIVAGQSGAPARSTVS
jgi:CBS domain-containing protein